ncbi:MAG: flagellar biosynthesis anti-sigma factor FlgM [Bacteroidetes bacterium]|jgi:negative regulator of flagellin synthesis FlgM|nr:flagellar biosynthesis anti-sigma factor FlgM [Bacteroidota bacterium]
MVDAIKNTVNRLDLTKGRSTEARATGSTRGNAPNAVTGDSVTVSEAASLKSVSHMADSPPVDMEAVRRIKDAIAHGKYPINVDQISEALMDAYRDMKT